MIESPARVRGGMWRHGEEARKNSTESKSEQHVQSEYVPNRFKAQAYRPSSSLPEQGRSLADGWPMDPHKTNLHLIKVKIEISL
jgi:hypothetical protein